MGRAAWFNCFSGIAGDMALGALLDAGAPIDAVEAALATLPVSGWKLSAEPVLRCGIRSTRAVVTTDETHVHRGLDDVEKILNAGALSERALARSLTVFRRLAQVEAALHGTTVELVHFHEVGALDAIVDIVGVCVALDLLGIDEIATGPVALGMGTIDAAHGTLPNPAPAVVELLAGFEVVGVATPAELTTPTGAAILSALAGSSSPVPSMTIRSSGFGAGARDSDGRPNVTQVVVGDRRSSTPYDLDGSPVLLLETNVDDVTPEGLAYVVGRAMELGAFDAWITPVVMKKGRPAHTVHVLCDPVDRAMLSSVLSTETGSLGVRATRLERWMSARHFVEVDLEGFRIAVKVGPHGVKPEHEDVERAARGLGQPLPVVRAEAERLARATIPGVH